MAEGCSGIGVPLFLGGRELLCSFRYHVGLRHHPGLGNRFRAMAEGEHLPGIQHYSTASRRKFILEYLHEDRNLPSLIPINQAATLPCFLMGVFGRVSPETFPNSIIGTARGIGCPVLSVGRSWVSISWKSRESGLGGAARIQERGMELNERQHRGCPLTG